MPADPHVARAALLLAGVAVGESRIAGLSGDPAIGPMVRILRSLGAEVWREGNTLCLAGRGVGALAEPDGVLDCGTDRTGTAWIAGLLAGHPAFCVLSGGAQLRAQSWHWLMQPLAGCGARITSRQAGLMPIAIEGAATALAIEARLEDGNGLLGQSLLLSGLNARGRTRILQPLAGADHLERMLGGFGAVVSSGAEAGGHVVELQGLPELRGISVALPGDVACAAFALVRALVSPGAAVQLDRVCLNPLRNGLLDLLREMGAQIEVGETDGSGAEPAGSLRTQAASLRGIDIPWERLATSRRGWPALAVAAGCARGITRLRGPRCSRPDQQTPFAGLAALLAAGKVRVSIQGTDMLVHGDGRPRGGGSLPPGCDPWLAMGGLLLGAAARAPVSLEDVAGIEAVFPGFASWVGTEP